MNKSLPLIIGLLVLIVVGTQTFFTVDQTQRALVLQLGRVVHDKPLEPGLHAKIPFIQNVLFFDSRILMTDSEPYELLTSEKKTLVVDNYFKWRIIDPLQFYIRLENIAGAQDRLNKIISSDLKDRIVNYTLHQIVAEKRSQIMEEVLTASNELVSDLGIEIVDVRIKRTDLPEENEKHIFMRMEAERQRQAKEYRSEGAEEKAKIEAEADKEREIILSNATKQSEIIRGDGDANATRIWAEAINQSPEFYAFKRSLEAYVKAFQSNTRIILTPDNAFMQYFE